MDKLRRVNNRLLKDHLVHLRDTLTTEPLSGAAVLHEMKFYHNRFYKTGLIKSGAYPLNALRKYHLSFTSDDGNTLIPLLHKSFMYRVMDDLGSAAAPEKHAQKATAFSVPVKFGSLPLAVDKKIKKDEEEGEMIDVGEEEVEVHDEDMVM
jgi:hypothetical protein